MASVEAKTPFRLSLFGGGTDFSAWYENHGGLVISTSINRFTKMKVEKKETRVSSEWRLLNDIDGFPAKVIEQLNRRYPSTANLAFYVQTDLATGSGLGSSSSLTLSSLKCVNEIDGLGKSNHDLALEAIELEHELIDGEMGIQDQIMAAIPGFNVIEINKEGSFKVSAAS